MALSLLQTFRLFGTKHCNFIPTVYQEHEQLQYFRVPFLLLLCTQPRSDQRRGQSYPSSPASGSRSMTWLPKSVSTSAVQIPHRPGRTSRRPDVRKTLGPIISGGIQLSRHKKIKEDGGPPVFRMKRPTRLPRRKKDTLLRVGVRPRQCINAGPWPIKVLGGIRPWARKTREISSLNGETCVLSGAEKKSILQKNAVSPPKRPPKGARTPVFERYYGHQGVPSLFSS